MVRRRTLGLTATGGLLVVATAAAVVILSGSRPHFRWDSFDKVLMDMTQEEVEAILGQPAGDPVSASLSCIIPRAAATPSAPPRS
jgi:hypothetical protein